MLLRKFRRGNVVSESTLKWILYLAILIAAGVAIKMIVSRVSG